MCGQNHRGDRNRPGERSAACFINAADDIMAERLSGEFVG